MNNEQGTNKPEMTQEEHAEVFHATAMQFKRFMAEVVRRSPLSERDCHLAAHAGLLELMAGDVDLATLASHLRKTAKGLDGIEAAISADEGKEH